MMFSAPKGTLRRAGQIAPAGTWTNEPVDVVVLAHGDRHRRRIVLTCESGRDVLLDLPEARRLRDGDGLLIDSGETIAVKAAVEALAEVRCSDARELARIAWHLGNRHLPTQIRDGSLRFQEDPVIVDMVRGLGVAVEKVNAPFEPEGGAYAHGDHGHPDHAHASDHDD